MTLPETLLNAECGKGKHGRHQAGVIIIDDYGHWKGSREACDEYFTENRIPILLNRIDYTGRNALKL